MVGQLLLLLFLKKQTACLLNWRSWWFPSGSLLQFSTPSQWGKMAQKEADDSKTAFCDNGPVPGSKNDDSKTAKNDNETQKMVVFLGSLLPRCNKTVTFG